MVEHSLAYPKVQSYIRAMDYVEACIMHLTPGVVHNFPKTVAVQDFCPLCTKNIPDSYSKRKRGKPQEF